MERDLFNQGPQHEPTGEELRDEGMERARVHADMRKADWSRDAYEFLLLFLQNNDEFLIEDVRNEAEGILPEPPSKRAWGSIAVKAAKEGHIRKIGYKEVTNPKAHKTPATLWKKI
jgi:hypothetical protein